MQRTVFYAFLATFCAMSAGQSLALDVGLSGGAGGVGVEAGASISGGGAKATGGANLGGAADVGAEVSVGRSGASVGVDAGVSGVANAGADANVGSGGLGVDGQAGIGGNNFSANANLGAGGLESSLGGVQSRGLTSLGQQRSPAIQRLLAKLKKLIICREQHDCHRSDAPRFSSTELAFLQVQCSELRTAHPDVIAICRLLKSL